MREENWRRNVKALAWSLLWTCRGCLCTWRCVPVREQCPRHAVSKGVSALFSMAASSSGSKARLLIGETGVRSWYPPPSALELQSRTTTLCFCSLRDVF